MTLDFPGSPTLDEPYEYNGVTYIWDGEKWVAQVSGVVQVTSVNGMIGDVVLDAGDLSIADLDDISTAA